MERYFLVKNALKEVVFACLAESENDKKITSVLSDGYTVEETTYPRFCFALQIMRHKTAKNLDALLEELNRVPKIEYYDPKAEVKAQKKHEREQMKLRSRYYGKYR